MLLIDLKALLCSSTQPLLQSRLTAQRPPTQLGAGAGKLSRQRSNSLAAQLLMHAWKYLLTSRLYVLSHVSTHSRAHAGATPPPVHACMHYRSGLGGSAGARSSPEQGQAAEAHSLAPTDDSFQDHEWNNCQKLREKKTSPETIIYRHSLCARM